MPEPRDPRPDPPPTIDYGPGSPRWWAWVLFIGGALLLVVGCCALGQCSRRRTAITVREKYRTSDLLGDTRYLVSDKGALYTVQGDSEWARARIGERYAIISEPSCNPGVEIIDRFLFTGKPKATP